jgi:DNA (cytosine-5)-methyltransferase 1
VDEKFCISNYETRVLEAWNEFYLGIDIKVVGYPIWADEFNKEYKATLIFSNNLRMVHCHEC